MTRTPHHSKKKKSAVHGLPLTQAAVGGFFIIWYVHIGRYASFVHNSLVVMVIAFSMPFGYTYCETSQSTIDEKGIIPPSPNNRA